MDGYGTFIISLQLTAAWSGGRIMEVDKPVCRVRCLRSEAQLMRDEHNRQVEKSPIPASLYSYRFQPDPEFM